MITQSNYLFEEEVILTSKNWSEISGSKSPYIHNNWEFKTSLLPQYGLAGISARRKIQKRAHMIFWKEIPTPHHFHFGLMWHSASCVKKIQLTNQPIVQLFVYIWRWDYIHISVSIKAIASWKCQLKVCAKSCRFLSSVYGEDPDSQMSRWVT